MICLYCNISLDHYWDTTCSQCGTFYSGIFYSYPKDFKIVSSSTKLWTGSSNNNATTTIYLLTWFDTSRESFNIKIFRSTNYINSEEILSLQEDEAYNFMLEGLDKMKQKIKKMIIFS